MKTFLPTVFIIAVLIFAGGVGVLFSIMSHTTIDFSALAYYDPARPSILLDDEGHEWGRFQLDKREPIPLAKIPVHLREAFLAAEDWDFFSHSGISWKGIIRSIAVNVYQGRIVQGASTITQQLVKLLFFDARKTFKRKIKEQLYALLLEQQFTKEQILETYLNHVYFGCGIYGVQAACQRFWGIDVAQVSLEQAALLAGIVRSPGSYCPLLCPLSAERRRNLVLQLMNKRGLITLEQYERAKSHPLSLVQEQGAPIAPHLKEHIRMQLEKQLGKQQLYSGGLIIQTTLHRATQEAAEKAFVRQMARLKETIDPSVEGALISLDVKTGHIKALVGGTDFRQSSFNRALQARRQIGSLFKPLIYAAALEQGMNFSDTCVDEPVTIKQGNQTWQPKNYNMKFEGLVTLGWALSHSSNIVAIKTLLKIGVHHVIELAKKCHIDPTLLHSYPSLALGCIDLTLKEAAALFNIFANNGIYVEPHCITWIKDRWGTKIFKASITPEPVIDTAVIGQIVKILSLGMRRLSKMAQKTVAADCYISKTGTTNDSRTCLFAGATPKLSTVVYVGCDNNQSMGKNTFPIRTAFPIWFDMYQALNEDHGQFIYDSSLKEIAIDEKTGEVCDKNERGAISILI